MKKPKMHKARFGGFVTTWCGRLLYAGSGLYVARYWKDVTCKRCLALRPKKRK